MFKIESYITSIILSNANKYIKNFRKEDAQVSLWEGDATFHNIDLNVDALNEEFSSVFIFTSGYIRDLTIHVPWTKLMSEPVAIFVNTIECVMKLKSKEEKLFISKKQRNSTSNLTLANNTEEKYASEEIIPSSSYSSTLTNKIMNNLSVRCENIILKLVEEDIVFSMNIEKLNFENVNDQWIQTITDFNLEKLLTRKLITLSGVTICLDKQNSSGRIEMYLEPLLYRCLIHVRLLRAYDKTLSKKPIYTHIDILSDKMLFTICEPQLPMLLKLGILLFRSNDADYSTDFENNTFNVENPVVAADVDLNSKKNTNENKDQETWGNWLWNMMPAILGQDDNISENKKEISSLFNIGFCVKYLEINLKILNNKPRKTSKLEFKNFIKSKFCGCFYQIIKKNNKWLNIQVGISHVAVEIPISEVENENNYNQVLISGIENTNNFMNDTLFNENFDYSFLKMHQKINYSNLENETDSFQDTSQYSDFKFIHGVEFCIDTHLNFCTENYLLEKTPAFVIDYVKIQHESNSICVSEIDNKNTNFEDNCKNDDNYSKSVEKNMEKITLLRFVFGSSIVKITSDVISRFTYLYKIISHNICCTEYHQFVASSKVKELNAFRQKYSIQFTIFDIIIKLYPSLQLSNHLILPKNNFIKTTDVQEMTSLRNTTLILMLQCKCIDGNITFNENFSSINNKENEKKFSIKAIEILCSLLHSNQKYEILKCGKLNTEYVKIENKKYNDLNLELQNILFSSSKPVLLLAIYIACSITYFNSQLDKKQKYYNHILFTSLIDDALLLSNTILEVAIENVNITYTSLLSTYNAKLFLNRCKAYINKFPEDTQKRIVIFSDDKLQKELSCVQVMLQYCGNCLDDCIYPSFIWFNINNLKINIDLLLYSWILYEPVFNEAQKSYSDINKNIRDHSVSKSGLSRKISDASSGSNNRKYCLAYPKPKESVHSSFEPEIYSPPEVTDTETSDLFQTADNIEIIQTPINFVQYLINNVQHWFRLFIYGEISSITVYMPVGRTVCEAESFKSVKSNSNFELNYGVFIFDIRSIKIKCDVPNNFDEELCSKKLISVPKNLWSMGKLTFPWTISVSDFSISTLSDTKIQMQLLKPLSINCTIGISMREDNANKSVVACVHFDFQSVEFSLNNNQVLLISNVLLILRDINKISNDTISSETTNKGMTLKSLTPENTVTENKVENKLTGWVQWTFTKCSLTLYHHAKTESSKLSIEAEDSIISLEFDDIFHKLKIKLASFNIFHRKRYSKNNSWQVGHFYGIIVQRCYSQLLNSNKIAEDDTDNQFLLATITRARSSNLKSRLSLSPSETSVRIPLYRDHYVTEIILKICPLDVVIPLAVIEKFLSVLNPLINQYGKISQDIEFQLETTKNIDRDVSMNCLPIIYFDIPMLRIFIPVYKNNDLISSYDTFICEIGSVHIDCHPENPVIRKQLNPDIYYSISGRRYTSIEQKLQNQQYQLIAVDVSINTSIWSEIEQMLIEEQISVEEPPSVLAQNPAVMWNQGCHPDAKNKIHLEHLSPVISKFICYILIAPPVEYLSLKAAIHGAYYEIDILSDLDITISLNQIPLLIALYNEYINCINLNFEYLQKEIINRYNSPSKINNFTSRLTDSGIESMEQSSVGSSTVSKRKSDTLIPIQHQINTKTDNQNLMYKIPNMFQLSGSTFKKEILKEVYITARSISFTLYKTSENNEKTTIFSGLLFSEMIQPYVLISNEYNDYVLQIGVFNISIYLPNFYLDNYMHCTGIPNDKKFYLKLLNMKTLKCDSYSKIKYDCFTLKMTKNTNRKWKIKCIIGQPVFIDCSLDIVQYMLSNIDICLQEYLNYFNLLNGNQTSAVKINKEENTKKHNFIDKIKNHFSLINSFDISTNNIIIIFKSADINKNLLLNVDKIKIDAKSPNNIKNSADTISILFALKSVILSLPKIFPSKISNVLSSNNITIVNEDILNNLILKPWDVDVECLFMWDRWNLLENNPWKCIKINSDSIIFNINPSYLETFSKIILSYMKLVENYKIHSESSNVHVTKKSSEVSSEYYKDDLRAGAFHYVKVENDRSELPSPYEVIFCNRQIQPYISWKYPQPRTLIKLQIYPVPIEDLDDDYEKRSIHCQLQYYSEITNCFHSYVSFNLCESTIQNVVLPNYKPRIIAAECWRIVLFEKLRCEETHDFKIDVRLLAGCVRVDSMFLSSLLANLQILLNISEIQLNLSTLCRTENIMVEQYLVAQVPKEQLFLSLTCNDIKIIMLNYDTDMIMKLSGMSKSNILNYEYLMLQSFIDPFYWEMIFYIAEDTEYKLASVFKNINFRVSPNFIHTLSVAKNLWRDWKSDVILPWKITVPYIICNNTNHFVTFYQENTSEDICLHLPPFYCHLFAWYSPAATKNLIISIHSGKKKFISHPLNIKKIGCHAVTCTNEAMECTVLFISVVKHSSVVYQVIIRGSLLIYNLTCSQMDLCIISYGKEEPKNKLSAAQVITKTSISKNELLSVVLPLRHRLSFKVRYRSAYNDGDHDHWSGLIPLISSEKSNNQMSWMVKIPLKNHKEHFQSFWCQLTYEICNEFPKYLVVFRPLCSVISFLPWKSCLKIRNDLGCLINTASVSEKGSTTDLFIPDTISLNKYTIEYMLNENSENCLSKIKFEKSIKQKSNVTNVSIDSVLDNITVEFKNNEWPFLNTEINQFSWKTDQVLETEPIVKVIRKEDEGCGTKLEIYPWAIIINTLSYPVILNISNTIFTIDCYEIFAPPRIENTFKLGVIEDGENYFSGILQLSDEQSFPIPKVTGRVPMNGFVTIMIDCDTYVTFLNITSKNYKEMRIINVCSSYVINNCCNLNVRYSAWIICRTGNKISTSLDIPTTLHDKCIPLTSNENSTVGQSIVKWYKIGSGDVQILPYLILCIDDNVACPIRIYDLSEKQRYPVIFSSTKSFSKKKKLPCIFMTAQQTKGQVFLTIWEENVPHVTIHNMSQLTLNVVSSKSEKEIKQISYSPDWNWKFAVVAESSAHFHVHKEISEKDKKHTIEYLMFSVENTKPVKQTKWSSGVLLAPCTNHLVTLPLSQQHIKLAIFRKGFTYVVWIESATSDELSAKMIRTRLSESFLPIHEKVISSTIRDEENIQIEESYEIPLSLKKYYRKGFILLCKMNIIIEEMTFTLVSENESTSEESDILSLNANNICISFRPSQKPNEVTEDIVCRIDIESYQLNNEEYYLRMFDFPIILLSKSNCTENNVKYTLEDLLSTPNVREDSALKINITFQARKILKCDILDIEVFIHYQNVYLEDKYLTKLRTAFENIFLATIESSNLQKFDYSLKTHDNNFTELKPIRTLNSSSIDNIIEKDTTNDVKILTKSSSSKSVNVSECETDDKSSQPILVTESNINRSEDCGVKFLLVDNIDDNNQTENSFQKQRSEIHNYTLIPKIIIERSLRIAKPLRLRSIYISSFNLTVSLHTSTSFYVAVDRSPLKFSEFKREYIITTPFELGNLLVIHYFMGAVYGTGWAISSLEFVGSPGIFARDLGTGIKDFVSMPLYGMASGPRGFLLGMVHGSVSLMKHVMTGTLSSVTNFAGSWARTLNRFTLDPDDLLQSEQIRRLPPSNIAEGVLQGLSEFGISLLGGISGIAHHPLQYAISNTGNRSLLNSISLGIVGVLTRPLSGAAELVAKTGQGILSHVGWNMIPTVRNGSNLKTISTFQITTLKYHWTREYDNIIFAVEAVNAQDISLPLSLILTINHLHITQMTSDRLKFRFDIQNHEFNSCDYDPTLIIIQKPALNFKNAEDFSKARILKFIQDTNQSFNIENSYAKENFTQLEKKDDMFRFCVNPQVKNSLISIITFIKNLHE